MSNIAEYYMYEAIRIDNGELIQGCYVKDYDGITYITLPLSHSHHLIAVKPETVHKVAVSVITERHRMNQRGDMYDKWDIETYRCPNCRIAISQQRYDGEKTIGDRAYKPNYCDDCGQRLKWDSEGDKSHE